MRLSITLFLSSNLCSQFSFDVYLLYIGPYFYPERGRKHCCRWNTRQKLGQEKNEKQDERYGW